MSISLQIFRDACQSDREEIELDKDREGFRAISRMAKKSRRRAAKYSELSRASKKKKRSKLPVATGALPVQQTQEVAEPKPVKSPEVKAAPKAKTGLKRAAHGYQYVRDDLRKVSLLAGIMILILVVLSFILG